jgi:hypothetical protein
MAFFVGSFLTLLKIAWYVGTVALLIKIASIINRWYTFCLQDEDLEKAKNATRQLIGRGRKEAELLLSGDFGRRVAMGYVFQDLGRFSEGQSYLNVYLRNRAKVAMAREIAELEDRRPKLRVKK